MKRWRQRLRKTARHARRAIIARPQRPVELDALLPTGRTRTVVLIAAAGERHQLPAWLRLFAGDCIHVVSSDTEDEWSETHVSFWPHSATAQGDVAEVISMLGPIDVIVDLKAGPVAAREALWRRLYLHLRAGGVYVVDCSDAVGNGFRREMTRWMRRVITTGDAGAHTDSQYRAFADATVSVSLSRDLMVLKKRRTHLLKVRDHEANRILANREQDLVVDELGSLPAGELHSRSVVDLHQPVTDIPWPPDRMTHPEMHLRHYKGRVAFLGNTLLHTERTILPESFRHLRNDPSNPKIKNATKWFARIPDSLRPHEVLAGDYYLLDPQYTSHFGHVMTEVVGRLWGWDRAKQRFPELRALVRTRDVAQAQDSVEYRLMRAYGIAEQDIVCVDEPVYVDSLVAASVMWHNAAPHHAHPALADVWARIRGNLVDPDAPTADRVFVSRAARLGRRPCHNTAEVDAFFESHGFTVIRPEEMDLGAQAAMFSAATTIAGFAGSAMFNAMFAEKLQTMILLSHEGYTARNEHLYCALLGCRLHYFWSMPDIDLTEKGWSERALAAPWSFDFDRNRVALEAVLEHC